MNKPLYETIDVRANTPEWLEARRQGISASDTPSLMVPDEAFGTPCTVYAAKVLGYRTPETTAMSLGHELEWLVACDYSGKMLAGRNIEYVGALLKSEEHPWLLATPDYWIQGFEIPGILEVKTTHERNRGKWDEVPIPYQLQVQQQLLVTGLETAFVAVGFIKATTYKYFEEHGNLDGLEKPLSGTEYFKIEADKAVQTEILEQTWEFWDSHVKPKVPPKPLTADDIKLVYPAVNGKEVAGDPADVDLLRQRRVLDQEMDHLKQKREMIDNQLKLAMKDAEIMTVNGKPAITWRQNGRRTFDVTRFKKDHKDLYGDYVKESETRSFLVKG